jgi:isopenicillin-N epimerase
MAEMSRSTLSDWPLDPEIIYLNHGGFGSCPRPVQETADELRRRFERTPMQFVL